MEEITQTKKPCHLKLLFKYGYLLYGLLMAAILCTLTYFGIKFDYISFIRDTKGLDIYVYVALGLFVFATILYYIYRAKTKCVSFADAMCIALIVTAPLIVAYEYFMLKDLKLLHLIILSALFLFNIVFIIIFAIRRDERNEKRDIIFTKNSLLGYYISIFRKFRFLGIMLITLLSVSFTYLFFNQSFGNLILTTVKAFPLVRYLIIVAIALFLAFLAIDASRRRVAVIDAILLSNVMSLPMLLMQIIFMNNSHSTQFIIWAAACGVFLIMMLIRMMSFDVTIDYVKEDSSIKCYLGAFVKKYNPILVLAVGAIITAILVFGYLSEVYVKGILVSGQLLTYIAPEVFPMSILTIASGLTVGIGLIFSFCGLAQRKVCAVDFVIVLNLILGIASIVGITFMKELIYVIVCVTFTFLNLLLLSARIRTVRQNLKK